MPSMFRQSWHCMRQRSLERSLLSKGHTPFGFAIMLFEFPSVFVHLTLHEGVEVFVVFLIGEDALVYEKVDDRRRLNHGRVDADTKMFRLYALRPHVVHGVVHPTLHGA